MNSNFILKKSDFHPKNDLKQPKIIPRLLIPIVGPLETISNTSLYKIKEEKCREREIEMVTSRERKEDVLD